MLIFHFPVSENVHKCFSTDVNGAAEQRSSLYGSADDAVKVRGGFLQLVHLRHAAREVLEALWRAAAWQGLITSIQPDDRLKCL